MTVLTRRETRVDIPKSNNAARTHHTQPTNHKLHNTVDQDDPPPRHSKFLLLCRPNIATYHPAIELKLRDDELRIKTPDVFEYPNPSIPRASPPKNRSGLNYDPLKFQIDILIDSGYRHRQIQAH